MLFLLLRVAKPFGLTTPIWVTAGMWQAFAGSSAESFLEVSWSVMPVQPAGSPFWPIGRKRAWWRRPYSAHALPFSTVQNVAPDHRANKALHSTTQEAGPI